ncbi:ATP-binding protein [Actinoplanes sp. N902-109]|uniref:ATP-binding protein n=1 Tax=Actinoplanes sp. (strain N902-109) TaxID=649831 RepID=UPI00032960EA|nr:ATP-binding protein [Actinoplanes sp. N902-109]AGL17229.1 Tetratricopeptide TPR_4 [Actinoplanes sp. N902-109]
MTLFGRRREIVAIERLLDRAKDGTGGILVIGGPPGSGKTALADAAAAAARLRGLPVDRTGNPGRGPSLLVLDGVATPDAPAAPDAPAGLDREKLAAGGAAVLVTTTGAGDLTLAPLSEAELGWLLPGRTAAVVHAIWLASGGLPGPALGLAAIVAEDEADAVAGLALRAPSRAEFLHLDVALLRLVEFAAARPLPPPVRARVLIRWARELLGDPSAGPRRRELAAEALRTARDSGDPRALAEVLDGRLHALWEPVAAAERLSTASEIVKLARQAGDAGVELRGLFWRFTALAELGDLDAAEAALVTYARTAELAGDAQAAVMALSRQAVLALVRGRLELVETLTEEVADAGRRAGLADTGRLTASLSGALAVLRGRAAEHVATLQQMARRLPGHFYEATAARLLVEAGRDAEAVLELDRLLPAVLAGSGPRWLGAVADLAFVAARGGDAEAVRMLYDALTPYRGRLVVWGGANMITGPVDDLLGRLAARLGRSAEALGHLDRAVAQEERLGALPWLCATLTARDRPGDRERARSLASRLGIAVAHGDEWRLLRDGDEWSLEAGAERARLKDVRGLHYLRLLLAAPGREIPALDLVAGGAGLRAPAGDAMLDVAARTAYRHRLSTIDQQVDEADRAGDVDRAGELAAERAALVGQLLSATGLGGRPRRPSAEAERARVNATRALSAVLTRLETAAPLVAGHLRASLRTGSHFRYQPASGGPQRWRVS